MSIVMLLMSVVLEGTNSGRYLACLDFKPMVEQLCIEESFLPFNTFCFSPGSQANSAATKGLWDISSIMAFT